MLPRICTLLPLFLVSDAVLDITFIANMQKKETKDLYLSCISGERDPGKEGHLQIQKDNSIIKVTSPPELSFIKKTEGELRVTNLTYKSYWGIFYCVAKTSTEQTKIPLINNSPSAVFLPRAFSVTANRGDNVLLAVQVVAPKSNDILWKFNGNYIHTSFNSEIVNKSAEHRIEHVSENNTGIYSTSFMGESPVYGTFWRLIVRGCPAQKWGSDCKKDCQECLNGGICNEKDGDCICPPGFMGTRCETACRDGMFGRNCQKSCGHDRNCKGLMFCLPDPYGCSCASGWHGPDCDRECRNDFYGPGCKLACKCKNGGTCSRFSGCQCPTGWRGQHCEKSNELPHILEMPYNFEWNQNSSPKLSCSASGNPLPVHGSIELRKLDGIILKAIKTITDSNNSTALFEIGQLTLEHDGEWECRVSTNGGQDARKFQLTVKVPPIPTKPPRLLEKSSKYLVVEPGDDYQGDGPIVSTRLHYKPKDSGASWSSIIVDNTEPIKLFNLKPSMSYQIRVQLTRPGDGGEGKEGPEAILKTDCPEPTVKPAIDLLTVEDRNTLAVSWSLPVDNSSATGFRVRLYGPSKDMVNQEKRFPVQVRSAKFPNMEYNIYVDVEVVLVNCESLGPPSERKTIFIKSQGPSCPRDVQATALSLSTIHLTWRSPIDSNGGIVKYIIEYRQAESFSLLQWLDTDDGNKTSKDVTGLNSSTRYRFRVRAHSKVPGEWSAPVWASTMGDGTLSFTPTTQGVEGLPGGSGYQLILAIVGSVSVTCVTILLALLALFCIRKNFFKRRRTFSYQSGSGEETILEFNSGTLTLTRRQKTQSEPLSYPILEWEDIKFEDVIGEGNFGQVIKAMIKKDGSKVSAAVKMLKEFASENDHRDFAGELEVLCKLGHHPNIINLIGACENRGYLYIAIEFAPFGNLLDFLRKSRVLETDPAFAKEHGTASTLTSQQLLQFAADVATGMQYLSEKQFIHRDLAARNVLVGENLMAKIADFGLSRGEEVYVKKTMGRLPVRWMAIESLNYSIYTTKSDVWSFGVLLWEIVSLGGTPYCGMTCAELYEKLPQGYRMEKPRNCDDEVYEMMRQCWRDRPYERPTFAQISMQLNRMLEARKAYVNMALFENFTYAGIDSTAEEA
ncbi:tyrosine-protein kinase receptor Tie-1 isoform X1 [Polypterus senegalus]|uniref:tyrosine-protein kinase receptor Tie-1 isoform X1 n=1 Tax=Polypterus senegalus TaxID=55291 RepID=UPI001966AEA6|nr:tyrosine-protein kinase receptor Tie-1 isoform X1 [Polypterus senegalus]